MTGLLIVACSTDEDQKVNFETSKDVKVVPSFEEMNLKEELLKGIYAYGTKFAWAQMLIMFDSATA